MERKTGCCVQGAVFAVFICGTYLPPRVFALRICLPLSSWPAINQCWMLPPRSLFDFDLFKRIDLLCAVVALHHTTRLCTYYLLIMYCTFTKETITSIHLLPRIIFCTFSKETIFFTIASHHFLHFFKRNNLLCSCPTSSDHKRPDDIWRHKVHHRRTHFEVQNLVQTSSNIWIEEIKASSWQSVDGGRMKYSHFVTSWFQ